MYDYKYTTCMHNLHILVLYTCTCISLCIYACTLQTCNIVSDSRQATVVAASQTQKDTFSVLHTNIPRYRSNLRGQICIMIMLIRLMLQRIAIGANNWHGQRLCVSLCVCLSVYLSLFLLQFSSSYFSISLAFSIRFVHKPWCCRELQCFRALPLLYLDAFSLSVLLPSPRVFSLFHVTVQVCVHAYTTT